MTPFVADEIHPDSDVQCCHRRDRCDPLERPLIDGHLTGGPPATLNAIGGIRVVSWVAPGLDVVIEPSIPGAPFFWVLQRAPRYRTTQLAPIVGPSTNFPRSKEGDEVEQPNTDTLPFSRRPRVRRAEPGRRCKVFNCPYPATYIIMGLHRLSEYSRCKGHADELLAIFDNYIWLDLLRLG